MRLCKKYTMMMLFMILMSCFRLCASAGEETAPQPVLQWAKPVDAGSIAIQWTGNPEETGMYLLYRKTEGTPYKMINAMTPDYSGEPETYTDTNVLPNQTYTYTVRSVPHSSVAYCAKSQQAFSTGGVFHCTYTWKKYLGDDLVSYVTIFENKDISYCSLFDKKKNSVSYDMSEEEYESFDFSAYALKKGGWSSYDKEGVSAKTSIKKVSVKKPALVGHNTVKLSWSESKGASGYLIYRKAGDGKWKKIQTIDSPKALYGYDDSVKKGVKYQYKVKAYVKKDKKTVTSADSNATKKTSYSSVAKEPDKMLYKAGNIYMAGLTSQEVKAVQNEARKFYQTYITEDMSDVEKVIAAQAYLAMTCVYGTGTKFYTAWGALVYKNKNGYHEATCVGYSCAMQALCAAMGLECRTVRPNAKAFNPSHMWTIVKVENKWYIVDPQPNANFGIYSYFLLSGKTYVGMTGETFDAKNYPAVSKKDYSREKLSEYASGYKVQRMLTKMRKKTS